jgi:hypothetical protein
MALDPEDQSPAGPQDTQSSDQSKPGLRAAWDAWTSRPENNAALLQFGLAMLQPRSPGQSGVGQFANAVGQGAEASDRNISAQRAETDAEAARTFKKEESSARTTTAQAYADQVRQGATKTDKVGAQGALRLQSDFRKWLAKPEDTTGLSVDPIVGALSKQFPGVKTKADLLSDPAARSAAFKLFSSQLAEPEEETDTAPGATTSSPAPAQGGAPAVQPAPQARIVYDKQGKPYRWDGVAGHQPVPVQQ